MQDPTNLVGTYVNYVIKPIMPDSPAMALLVVNGALPNQVDNVAGQIWTDPPPPVPPRPGAVPQMGAHRVPAPAPVMGGHRGVVDGFTRSASTWPFFFLKYVPGRTTVAPLGHGVLTGPISGCYLFRYILAGVTYMSHVGTADDPADDRSVQAKADWLTLVGQPTISHVFGGTPIDYFSTPEVAGAMLSGNPMDVSVCAYYTATDAWAVMLSKVPGNRPLPPGGLSKICGVKKMTLQPWTALYALRKFSGEYSAVKRRGAFKLS